MPLPNQNIPEKQKDAEWCKLNIRSITTMVGTAFQRKQKDKFCYDLYAGIFNEADYDYLRKVDSYEYPAKIRFIPLLRPKADLLKSQETQRPFNFRVFTIDQLSIENKTNKKTQEYFDIIKDKLFVKHEMILSAKKQLDKIKQQIDAARGQAQQAQQEGGPPMDPEQEMALEAAEMQLKIAMSPLTSAQIITEKEMEKIEKYYNYTYRDFIEVIAEKSLKYMVYKHRLKDLFQHGFEDKICVDKEYYYVHFHPSDQDPLVRRVNPLNFYYSNDEDAEFVGECEWAMEERWMTLSQIIDEFKTELSSEDLTLLRNKQTAFADAGRFSYYPSTYQFGTPMDNNTDNCNNNSLYSGTMDMSNKIRVCYAVWKSSTEIKFKKSPNKYNKDINFTHWMGDSDSVRKDDVVEAKYVNHIWEGVLIDSNIFIRMQKMPYQLRSIDKYGRVDLPYVGIAHNGLNKKPYSLIWAAKDIQILYNLIHYHKELWLALSGVRGFIMDKSQLPDGMSMQEWLYQRKLGIGWIQTVKEGMGRQASYNQFQNFDDSISPAIQYLTGMLTHLEELASNIMGVSRQRQGTVGQYDLKGTTESAIQQSQLVTEIIYYQHDLVKRQVLQRLVNLCRIAWKDGKRGQYVIGNMAQEILNIPSNTINSAEYEVFMSDNGKEERLINEFKQVAAGEHAKGTVNLGQMVKLFSMDNLSEIERALEQFGTLAEQKASEGFQMQQQAEMQKSEAENQFKAMLDKWKSDIAGAQLELEKQRFGFEVQKFESEMGFKEKELSTKSYLDELNTKLDNDSEMAYLESENAQAIMEYDAVKEQNRIAAMSTLSENRENSKLKASNIASSKKGGDIKKRVKGK